MFIRSKKDVDVYARKIYAYIANTKGEKYIEFIQNLLNKKQVRSFDKKYKIEEIFRIIVADIHDFLDKMNFCDFEIRENENLSVKEINESKYINDETFVEYALYKFEKSYSHDEDVNIKYLIKSILISIFDVNENFKYALRGKNKDADPRIKFLIAKYTDAKIKVTANVLRKIGVRVDKSMSIHRFAELYERYVENRINEFEAINLVNEEEIKLTEKDLLVYYYLKSYSKKLVDVRVEEIAKDCKISSASVSRSIIKLEKARKIRVNKIKNKNVYEILDYEEQQTQKIPETSRKIENKRKFAVRNIENKKETKENSKTEKNIDKSIEIHTSSLDFKKRSRGERLDVKTRYKLYLFRQKYKEELENLHLKRLSRDDTLFFLINTEKNETLTLNKILKIIKYADSNPKIKNPVGWLIERFQIGRGRFYFLLRKSKKRKVEKVHPKSNDNAKIDREEQEKQNYVKDIYINSDLAYFMKKYNISSSEISSYLSKFKYLSGDVSYIVERYIANYIWKNLPSQEKQKLISYAKRRIRNFAVPPSTEEEFKEHVKSIVTAKIKDDYLTLSIQQRLQLQMSGQYDTS